MRAGFDSRSQRNSNWPVVSTAMRVMSARDQKRTAVTDSSAAAPPAMASMMNAPKHTPGTAFRVRAWFLIRSVIPTPDSPLLRCQMYLAFGVHKLTHRSILRFRRFPRLRRGRRRLLRFCRLFCLAVSFADRGHVIHRFRKWRHIVVLGDGSFARIVCRDREPVVLKRVLQKLEILHAAENVLARIERVSDPQAPRRLGHELHQSLGSL